MSTRYKFHDQGQLYFVTFAVVNWIDLFIRNEYKDIMIESWKHCQAKKGLEIYGRCIMSSHIHMIIGTRGEKLENIMRDSTTWRKNAGQRPKAWRSCAVLGLHYCS